MCNAHCLCAYVCVHENQRERERERERESVSAYPCIRVGKQFYSSGLRLKTILYASYSLVVLCNKYVTRSLEILIVSSRDVGMCLCPWRRYLDASLEPTWLVLHGKSDEASQVGHIWMMVKVFYEVWKYPPLHSLLRVIVVTATWISYIFIYGCHLFFA